MDYVLYDPTGHTGQEQLTAIKNLANSYAYGQKSRA